MKTKDIQPEAWVPFAEGVNGIFTNPVLAGIGEKYGKSPAQVILRWQVQEGIVIIPKSVRRERMKQNFDILDFELNDEGMAAVETINNTQRPVFDHNNIKNIEGFFTNWL